MKISSRLFSHLLSEKYPVERMGGNSRCQALSLPVFYEPGMEPEAGKVYVTQSQHLPKTCRVDCLFVCAGNRPVPGKGVWRGEILYISDRNVEFFRLFNSLMEDYQKLGEWTMELDRLLENRGRMDDFVRCSLPVFENAITITDYNLRILSNCEAVEVGGKKQVIISDRFQRVPEEVGITLLPDFLKQIQLREPFFYKGQRENPEGYNYCINLYQGDSYIGTCTLWDALHPIRESDQILFQYFAACVQKVLANQNQADSDQIVTLRSIFEDLLRSYPVSAENLKWALDMLFKNLEFKGLSMGCWHCLVIRSANSKKELPKEYFRVSIENMLPHCFVLDYEEDVVCFCAIPEGENCEDTVLDILLPYLKDMNFRVGVSSAFIDLFRAREYYLQALAILNTGYRKDPKEYIYQFDDYILPYMLRHSMGEFDFSMIESNRILELKNAGSSVDYWDTLRRYLDNECNASKTAQELFLHRSSLLPRLEKIRSIVDMDTPEQRLYLRICMYLSDLLEKEQP